MIEFFKINKKTNEKTNLPKKIDETNLKIYIVLKKYHAISIFNEEYNPEGKAYLDKKQAELNAKILQVKNPFANYSIYEMEVE